MQVIMKKIHSLPLAFLQHRFSKYKEKRMYFAFCMQNQSFTSSKDLFFSVIFKVNHIDSMDHYEFSTVT